MTGEEILDIRIETSDTAAETIREYLKGLLYKIWSEGEGFNGKRPFGNSGWEYDLYQALEAAGITDRKEQNQAIFDAIEALT